MKNASLSWSAADPNQRHHVTETKKSRRLANRRLFFFRLLVSQVIFDVRQNLIRMLLHIHFGVHFPHGALLVDDISCALGERAVGHHDAERLGNLVF